MKFCQVAQAALVLALASGLKAPRNQQPLQEAKPAPRAVAVLAQEAATPSPPPATLIPCKGSLTSDSEQWSCEGHSQTDCPNRFTQGLTASVQCGFTGGNCLATGPACLPP
eukprot:gb/GFBE01013738.1/.p1 GENE.gb/GFBE01013738.1/~~gb/GFBE01013738.1/.p1  ORF type:complete len:111 (+),score=19.63 gb/GFBE01013738.1/:1-333(+)